MSWLSKLSKALRRRAPGGSVLGDASAGAEWIAKALSESGYAADFSLHSLREVDRFFDEQAPDGRALPNGLLAQHLGSRLFCIGAYCGEVIRRQAGGVWSCDERDPQAEINLTLELPDGTQLWPVQRAMKRFQLGRGESLHAYASTILTSPPPAQP